MERSGIISARLCLHKIGLKRAYFFILHYVAEIQNVCPRSVLLLPNQTLRFFIQADTVVAVSDKVLHFVKQCRNLGVNIFAKM